MICYLAVKTHLYALVNSKYFHLEPFWNHIICKAAAKKTCLQQFIKHTLTNLVI